MAADHFFLHKSQPFYMQHEKMYQSGVSFAISDQDIPRIVKEKEILFHKFLFFSIAWFIFVVKFQLQAFVILLFLQNLCIDLLHFIGKQWNICISQIVLPNI